MPSQRFVAGAQGLAIRLQPGEERPIAEETVLGDFGVTGQNFTRRQAVQGIDIGKNQAGLMVCSDEVLSVLGVDAGLAADGTVDLRQQGRRYLHYVEATKHDAGGETGKIPDHAAAEGDEGRGAIDADVEQAADEVLEDRKILALFSRRDEERLVVDAGAVEGRLDRRQMDRRHRLIADDDDAWYGNQRRQTRPGFGHQALADDEVISPLSEIDTYGLGGDLGRCRRRFRGTIHGTDSVTFAKDTTI